MDFKKLVIYSIAAIPIVLFDIFIINGWKWVYEHNICYINTCDCDRMLNCTNCRVVEEFCFGVNPMPFIFMTILAICVTITWICAFTTDV